MSGSQTSSVPETPTPVPATAASLDIIANWAQLLTPNVEREAPLTWPAYGLLYERRDRPTLARRGAKVSPIWAAGTWYTAAAADKAYEAWLCGVCQAFVRVTPGSSSNAMAHWRAVHSNISLEEPSPVTPRRSESSALLTGQRRLYRDVNIDKWRARMLRWMIQDRVPFAQVDSVCFREVLTELHPPIERYLMSRTTIRRWLDDESILAVDQVHGFAMLGVYGHFVSGYSATVRAVLLALKRIEGGHSGEEVAELLTRVVRFWRLEKCLGVFVGDNAEGNDVAISKVLSELGLVNAGTGKCRSRCLGHIINLAAKAFLFGTDVEVFESAVEVAGAGLESTVAQRAQAEWRKKGPIGKVHNLVVYIRSSSLRREAFRKKRVDDEDIDRLELVTDNARRWNSTYYMLHRVLRVEERIRQFVQDPEYRRDVINDTLTDQEWDQLRQIAASLKPFHDATQRLQGAGKQGHHGSIWEALPTLEYLLKQMEVGVQTTTQNRRRATPLEVAYQNAWQKLQKYYNLTDDCHEIYAAGLLFHPCHRRGYFDSTWRTVEEAQYKEKMLKNVKNVWETIYCNAVPAAEEDERLAKRQRRSRSPDAIEKHLLATYENAAAASEDDEFDAYIGGARLNNSSVDNIIAWWTEQPGLYSPLRRQALDVLSIPAMNTDCERLFSSAADLVGYTRHSLHDDTMESLELLRQWLQQGLVTISGEI